ncbi:hypothetical protein TNCV_4865171 [Trichonephila clavipes]|nr:hypothetical protein TNCV_4865171 [Trichonephila clavipes]
MPPSGGRKGKLKREHRTIESNEGRVVVYRASTPQVWGSINGLDKVDSAFHPRYIGSINKYQACLGSYNTEGLSSDRPPNRDICSCTSAPNGHVYWGGHSSWPSWIVVPLEFLSSRIASLWGYP